MAVVGGVATFSQIAIIIEDATVYDSVAAALADGAVQAVGDSFVGSVAAIEGGAATEVISTQTALQVAQAAELAATDTTVKTAATTLVQTQSGFSLAGILSMPMPAVATAAAPLAGVVLGGALYESNPELWTKISATLLPWAYEGTNIKGYLDFLKDPDTGKMLPIALIPTAIVDALKKLFNEEVNLTTTYMEKYNVPGKGTYTVFYPTADTIVGKSAIGETARVSPNNYNRPTVAYIDVFGNLCADSIGGTGTTWQAGWMTPQVPLSPGHLSSLPENPKPFPPTVGVEAPSVPVEPIVWPNTPIIIIPEPLGPDYQPIPVTPITPLPLPAPDPVPLLPAPAPEPAPDAPPENWPDEEPWPTVVPFPVQPTEPDPDWPTVIPWPLPPERPEEWPTHPVPWTFPEELPWPRTPSEWPEEVPWPDSPPDPEAWPEEIPWPESPEDWPEEVPWPVPWPEEWPETEPWPVKWPDEVPYPLPWQYPTEEPSQDPYPDPEQIEDPSTQIDPYILPWPTEYPTPAPINDPDSNPNDDPSQPEDKKEKEDPPQDPDSPTLPPSDGTIAPPPVPYVLPFDSSTGLISVYHPTTSELFAFSRWLWVTYNDPSIQRIWNNPFDGVISLFELYCTPTDVGRKNIRSGFLDSGISSETISRYTQIDCGTIGVPEYYGNYLDYTPYAKVDIYLPFIGIVELSADDIVGHAVNVTYRIDEYNGSCIAMITIAQSTELDGERVDYSNVKYQFSGNCSVELPFAGGSQAAIRVGMMQAAAYGIAGILTAATAPGIGGAMSAVGHTISGIAGSILSPKSTVQHSGSFGSSCGAMGCKKPFITVTRPRQVQVPNYNKDYGYQAHKMVVIGDCTGYIRCREIHVISSTASDEEKSQIEDFLKSGVYVTE